MNGQVILDGEQLEAVTGGTDGMLVMQVTDSDFLQETGGPGVKVDLTGKSVSGTEVVIQIGTPANIAPTFASAVDPVGNTLDFVQKFEV